jgi:transcriptional regulator with XRE-family HTH domain
MRPALADRVLPGFRSNLKRIRKDQTMSRKTRPIAVVPAAPMPMAEVAERAANAFEAQYRAGQAAYDEAKVKFIAEAATCPLTAVEWEARGLAAAFGEADAWATAGSIWRGHAEMEPAERFDEVVEWARLEMRDIVRRKDWGRNSSNPLAAIIGQAKLTGRAEALDRIDRDATVFRNAIRRAAEHEAKEAEAFVPTGGGLMPLPR